MLLVRHTVMLTCSHDLLLDGLLLLMAPRGCGFASTLPNTNGYRGKRASDIFFRGSYAAQAATGVCTGTYVATADGTGAQRRDLGLKWPSERAMLSFGLIPWRS